MTIWVDAQLSPRLARWITANFPLTAQPLRDLGLREAEDDDIFAAARSADVILLKKDSDFIRLLEKHGSHQRSCGLPAAIRRRQRYSGFLDSIFQRLWGCSKAGRTWWR